MTAAEDPTKQRVAMASRLKEAREYLGLSQDDAAAVLKISRPAITNIESGNRKVEAIELDQLAKLYGRSVNYFLSSEEGKVPTSDKAAFYARAFKDLSEKDLGEVARFADFLRAGGSAKKASARKPK